MEFEWDEEKRASNIAKHGLDFVSAVHLFSGPRMRKRARDGLDGEVRWLAVGVVRGLHVAAIYTERGGAIRMISLRRARNDERRHHQDVFG